MTRWSKKRNRGSEDPVSSGDPVKPLIFWPGNRFLRFIIFYSGYISGLKDWNQKKTQDLLYLILCNPVVEQHEKNWNPEKRKVHLTVYFTPEISAYNPGNNPVIYPCFSRFTPVLVNNPDFSDATLNTVYTTYIHYSNDKWNEPWKIVIYHCIV